MKAFREFRWVDLLVILGLLAGILCILPAFLRHQHRHSDRVTCMNHLKNVGLGMRIFAVDHQDKFPMQLPAKQGGSQEAIKSGEVYRHFQVVKEELSDPRILFCPTDHREPAADWGELENQKLSYFVGLDADVTKPYRLLSGDRHVKLSRISATNQLLTIPTAASAGWDPNQLHSLDRRWFGPFSWKQKGTPKGNIVLSDGSVQIGGNKQLQKGLKKSDRQPVRLAVP